MTSPPPAAPAITPDLNDTAWTLAEIDGAAVTAGATMRFAEGRVSGSDGCNRFSSTYTAQDGKLGLGAPRAGTQMACPERETKLAAAFHSALDRTRGYRIEGGALLLLDAGSRPVARLAAQASTLAGTAWQVIGYNNGRQAVTSVLGGTSLTMDFGADGRLSGSAGCNTYGATYQAVGGKLSIGPARATRMACTEPEGRMAQEAAFLAALGTVATAQREGDRLELRTASGALAVSARLATRP